MPPTLVARRIEDVRGFQKRLVEAGYSGDLVIKPLHGNGKAVFRVPASGDNLGALVEVFSQMWPEPYMVQPFLPDVAKGTSASCWSMAWWRAPSTAARALASSAAIWPWVAVRRRLN
jgi:glutathione synthase/RimK-type ligase-like ATP-grasp enzyme